MPFDLECTKKKLPACRRASAIRAQSPRDWNARLGARAGAVLLGGALPSGSFDAGFRFTVERGLEPLVSFDPSFLAVGLPKLSAE